uniref:Uncharacterized protein n=1 Tax=Heterorhabditis bacteriophora TaxID=37862 RepID=A0A1I7X0K1_HETBA
MPTKRLPRSLSAPVFQKSSKRLVNVLLFKLREMRVAAVGAITCGIEELSLITFDNSVLSDFAG